MPFIAKRQWDWDELEVGLMLLEPLLFTLVFWRHDLTIPESRLDLPAHWRGRQVISREQRIMCEAGADYMLLRDTIPVAAALSAQRVALRTSRKIAKTLFMESHIFQIAICKTEPGTTEGMIHAPGDAHLSPTVDRVERRKDLTPLFRLMWDSFDKANGINGFRNGFVWHWRIEGSCLDGETLLTTLDSTGIIGASKVRDMIDATVKPTLLAVDPDTYAVEPISEYNLFASGEQDVFELTALDGWSVKATANHPFLTPTGWRRLDELQPNDMVAVLRDAPGTWGEETLSPAEARLLGYFVGDGGTTHGAPRFTCFDDSQYADFQQIVETLYPGIAIKADRPGHYNLTYGQRGGLANPLTALLREHGVWDKLSHEKRVPEAIMQGSQAMAVNFLAAYFATDGSLVRSGQRAFVTMSSNSRALIDDVLLLLLRLGIRMRVKLRPSQERTFPGGRTYTVRDAWEISTSEAEDIRTFQALIPVAGVKAERLAEAVRVYADTAKAARIDAIPSNIVKREVALAGLSHNETARRMGFQDGDKFIWKFATCSRESTAQVNRIIHSPVLANLLDGPVGWRKLKSIQPAGRTMTYDFQVPGLHNAVANGFVVHNSGTGRNMVGLRAKYLLGDEGDYACEPAFNERDQTALPGAFQYWGGVPRGIRGIFWRLFNQESMRKGWHLWRYDMRANPLYHSQSAWDDQVKGDYNSQRVQTQILGRDGEEAVTSFPVIPVDATQPFVVRAFALADYERYRGRVGELLKLPLPHKEPEAWLIYGDYGYSPSPTELGVAYLSEGVWHTLARIEFRQLDTLPTAELIVDLDTQVLPRRAAVIMIDAHGQGRGVLSALHADPRWSDLNYLERAIDVGFAGSTTQPGILAHKKCKSRVRSEANEGMYICDTCHERIYHLADLTEATIQTKAFLTDEMKEAFAHGQQWLESGGKTRPPGHIVVLGRDEEGIEELTGTTELARAGGTVKYVPPRDSEHITDQYRCFMSAVIRYSQMITSDQEANYDEEFGWAPGSDDAWSAPWEAEVGDGRFPAWM